MNGPVIRYHGGKWRLAPWIISHFPPHVIYVEPFGGAGSVLMQKEPSWQEVYNDLDGDIVNLFRVLRDPDQAAELVRLLELTPYARDEFQLAYSPATTAIEQARRTVVRAQMGFGSAGATKTQTGFRIDSRRKHGTAAHSWAAFPPQIAKTTERLQGVIIENKPAFEVIENHDGPATLFYLDPPYVHATRQMRPWRDYYRHEMSDTEHSVLLSLLRRVEGFVVLSGYDTELYNDALPGWKQHRKRSRISAGRGTAIKIECLWINPQCADACPQLDMPV